MDTIQHAMFDIKDTYCHVCGVRCYRLYYRVFFWCQVVITKTSYVNDGGNHMLPEFFRIAKSQVRNHLLPEIKILDSKISFFLFVSNTIFHLKQNIRIINS